MHSTESNGALARSRSNLPELIRHVALADYCDLLALLLQTPTPEMIQGLINPGISEDYRSIASELKMDEAETDALCVALDDWRDVLARSEEPLSLVRREHTRLFAHPSKPVIPFYEGLFLSRSTSDEHPENALLFVNEEASDAEKIYRRAGVECSTSMRVPPDCITTELEFCAHLHKEAARAVLDENDTACKSAEALLLDFEKQHVDKWFTAFFARCKTESRVALYSLVGSMGLALLGSNEQSIA